MIVSTDYFDRSYLRLLVLHVYPPLHGQSEGDTKFMLKQHFSHFGTCLKTLTGFNATESTMHRNTIYKKKIHSFVCLHTYHMISLVFPCLHIFSNISHILQMCQIAHCYNLGATYAILITHKLIINGHLWLDFRFSSTRADCLSQSLMR